MPRQTAPLSIEHVLLGFLDQEPIHGYDLFKRINAFDAIGMVWKIKQSQLYALLERLEEEGLVTSTVIQGGSHPNKKQYHITEQGRNSFMEWRSCPVEHGRELRMEFLAKLYFAMQPDPRAALDLVDKQRNYSAEWLRNMKETLATIPETLTFERIVMHFRISQIQATLDWLFEVRNEIHGPISTTGKKKRR